MFICRYKYPTRDLCYDRIKRSFDNFRYPICRTYRFSSCPPEALPQNRYTHTARTWIIQDICRKAAINLSAYSATLRLCVGNS